MADTKVFRRAAQIFIDVDGVVKREYWGEMDWFIETGRIYMADKSPNYPRKVNCLIAELQDEDGNAIGDLAACENYLAAMVKGLQDVDVQDQHTPMIIAKLSNVENETTMSVAGAIDDTTITVTSATGFAIGKYMSVFDIASNRFYVGYVVAVSGSIITLDSPLDFAYPSGSFVTSGESDMAVNGSITPVIYGLRNTTETIGITADITRIFFTILSLTAPAYDTFGDLAKLLNGIVLRKVDGTFRNIFNLKTNGELAGLMFDVSAADAVNPSQGQNGYIARLTFAGQNKLGVTARLAPGEDLQLIIQDDLSGLDLFEITCGGHEVLD